MLMYPARGILLGRAPESGVSPITLEIGLEHGPKGPEPSAAAETIQV